MAKKIKTEEQTSEISDKQLTKELNIWANATKEQLNAAKEILAKGEEEQTKKLLTNPSAIALTTTEHSAGEGVNKVRKTVRQLLNLYLTNQFVSRAVNVRADTLISRGYKIVGEDEAGIEACQKLIDDSGGINLFWQLGVNTYIAGDGFLEKVYNQKQNKILKLKHVHPLTLSFKRDEKTGKIVVGKDKEPIGYVQYSINSDGTEVKKDVSKARIEHLRFNTLGDEFTGVSLFQSGYDTIVRLMNMEYSAAEAAVKTANPLIVGKCNTKSPHQIAQWGQILGNISGRDQIFVPQGMEIEFMSPGAQNFNDYADYFLNAVVAATGVPKSVLLGDSGGSSGNRAEGIVLSRHFYNVIRSDQRYVGEFFYKIFKEYGDIAGFKAPKLIFEDLAEDATVLAQSAIELFNANIIDLSEARQMIGLEPGMEEGVQGVSADIKKSKRQVQFPESPGKPEGSQKGIKDTQKINPNSEVSPITK